MKVTCRYEIPKEAYEHSNGDIGEYVGDRIVRELCQKIADIVANGGEYIFRMTPNDILENPYTNLLSYQRYVLYEPLMRCKACKHRYMDGDVTHYYWCRLHDRPVDDTDYCSWGEESEVEE